MMVHRRYSLTVLLIASFLLQSQAGFGQQSATRSFPGYPIEIIDLQPRYVLGSDVEIKGTAIPPQKADDRVSINIIPPDGVQKTTEAMPDADGGFVIKLPKIAPEGRFTLSIVGFGGAEKKEIGFDVVKAGGAIENTRSRLESLSRSSSEIIANVDRHLAARPQDAETTNVRRNLERLTADHNRITERVNKTRTGLGHLETAITSEPRVQPAAADGLAQLSGWANSAAEPDEELKRLAAQTRSMPTKCDSLETAGEALAFVSTTMNLIGNPTQILKNLLIDKVNPAILNLRTDANENARFAATEGVKISAAALEGMNTLKTSVVGLAGDAAQLLVGKLFANYCSVLEGTVDSDFNVDHKLGGRSWWKYRVVLKGKFRLWAEKDQPAGPDGIVYTGKMEGNAVKIEFFEDIFVVEPPPRGLIFLRKRITPIVVGNTSNEPLGFGQIARTLTPGHFNIRYKGQLRDDKIALKQETVLDDFLPPYAKNRVIIGVKPAGIALPMIKTYDFPIQKAAWMIDRTTKSDLVLTVQRLNDKMILKQTFTRNETLPDGMSKVTFKVDYSLSS